MSIMRAPRLSRAAVRASAMTWALVLAGCADTSYRPVNAAPQQHNLLGPGDIFEVRVFGEEELSGSYRVSESGTIEFPLVGTIEVKGATDTELSNRLSELLRKYVKEPHVSIYVKEYNSKKVFVFGQVQKPGTFKFEQGMNIVEAITLAGGFATLADQTGTYVTRTINGSEQRIKVSVPAIGEGRAPNLTLEPGDIIYVPEAIF
jgi:polysaccharide export outer membrane protein